MSRKNENTGFVCNNCGKSVVALTNGGYRNHCPFCLCSVHLDEDPGDRSAKCGGIMRPRYLKYKPGKGFQIAHICEKCGRLQLNKIAENTEQPDDISLLSELSSRGDQLE